MPRRKRDETEPQPPSDVGGEKRTRGRPPSGKPRLLVAETIKAGEAWRAWLARYAAHQETTKAKVIERALRISAKADKFEPPPSRET